MFCRFLLALCIGPCVLGEGHKILSRPLLFFFHRLTQGPCGFWQTPWAISCWKNIHNLQFSSPIFPVTYFLPNHHTPWTTSFLSSPPCAEALPQLSRNILSPIPHLTIWWLSWLLERRKKENIVNECKAAAKACVWCYETLQDPTPPPQWLVDSFLSGWALSSAIARFHPTPLSFAQSFRLGKSITSWHHHWFVYCIAAFIATIY